MPEADTALSAPSLDDLDIIQSDIDETVEDEYDSEEGEEGAGEGQRAPPRYTPTPPPPYSLHPTLSQLAGMHDPSQAQSRQDQNNFFTEETEELSRRRRSLDRRPLSSSLHMDPKPTVKILLFPRCSSGLPLRKIWIRAGERRSDCRWMCQLSQMPSVPRLSMLDTYS